MKTRILILGLLLFMASRPLAAAPPDAGHGLFLSAGSGQNEIDVFRLAWRYQPGDVLFCLVEHCFHGYYETSLGHWGGERNDIGVLSFSPVLTYRFHRLGKRHHPYIELGVGVALLSRNRIDRRDLSSALVFEDRIGFGIRSRHMDLGFRLMHYSNAGLKEPNDGLSMALVTLGYWF